MSAIARPMRTENSPNAYSKARISAVMDSSWVQRRPPRRATVYIARKIGCPETQSALRMAGNWRPAVLSLETRRAIQLEQHRREGSHARSRIWGGIHYR